MLKASDYFTDELTHDINNDLKNLNLEEETFKKFCNSLEKCYEEYDTYIRAYEIIYKNDKHYMFINYCYATGQPGVIIINDKENITTGEIFETAMELYNIDDGTLFSEDNIGKIIASLLNNNNKNEIMEKLKNKYKEEKYDKDDDEIIMDIVNMYS